MKKTLLFIVLLLLSCSESYPQTISKNNFYFEYWKGEDYYNSREGAFSRNYEAGYDRNLDNNVLVNLNSNEIDGILKSMNMNNVNNLPNNIKCGLLPIKDAQFIHIKIYFNDKIKEIYFQYNRKKSELDCSKAIRFLNVSKKIDSILYNKSQVKKLPQTNLFYE
ncbi:hypothetical protein [Chryseobacterium lathyri]|uniref:hypothetical protein n=1 Tax=Chryseobacterium lathyri TaxID=395933 RepID=UPI001CBE57CB|nr:hypothetical protein [Chryseobacterium lathyri]